METVSRRSFLKQTFFGSVVLSSSGFLLPAFEDEMLSPEISDQLQYFSPKEFLVIQSVAERIVGTASGNSSATDLDAALRADKFLGAADPEIQEQFHQLLTVFNAPFFAFLFDFRFSSFIGMSPEDQDSYLEDWMNSSFAFRRTGFQALKRVCLSMFYTEPRSWPEIGYDGKFEPS